MSNMASTTSGGFMKGFSVLQPSLGAPLSWMPAVGTKELEQLINAYLPGPASAQEKRATISVDFFEFAAQTGENFKYYPVQVSAPQATRSPASSAFSVSPAMSSMSYGSPSQPSTPASRTASRASGGAKAEKTDYSHLPGMKILTTDGQDVTNSVSRGCKSKEQREHAHLMRVLKACDACKKKKIRCDPSHKRRSSSQASTKAVSKPAKKAKKASPPSASQATSATSCTPAPQASFEFDMDVSLEMDFGDLPSMDIDDILAFNPEPIDANIPQDFYGAVPQDFDFFLSNEFSPANVSSTDSFDSPAQPLTPVGSGLFSQGHFTAFSDTSSLAFLQASGQEPSLPYMNPDVHGSNYVDFNLYSPAGSFIDEEPQKLKAGEKRRDSALQSEPISPQSQMSDGSISPADLSKARPSTGLANEQQTRVNRSGETTLIPQELQWQDVRDRLQQAVIVRDELVVGVVSHGDQASSHGDNGGHDSGRVSAVTQPHGLPQEQQAMRRNSPLTAPVLPDGLERTNLPLGSLSPVSPASTPVSPRDYHPQFVHLDETRARGGAPVLSRTVSPSELQVVVSSPSTSLAYSPITAHALPAAAPSTVLSSMGRNAHVDDVLPAAGRTSFTGVLSVQGEFHSLVKDQRHKPAAANGSSPSTASARADETAAPTRGLGSQSGSAPLFRLEDEGRTSGAIIATTTTTSTSRLGLPSHGHQRQALHSMIVNNDGTNTASRSSRRALALTREGDAALLNPVRQWPGHATTTSSVLLTPLAVFGLVSMLLIVGLTSLLQLQIPIIAHLPSSSLVLLLFLSTLSPRQDALDSVRSIQCHQSHQARRRLGLPAMAGLARLPVACF